MGGPADHVLGVLVTFHPDPRTVPSALRAAAVAVDRLVVVDNDSTPESRRLIQGALEGDGVAPAASATPIEVIPNARNEGVSVAFNQGIARALETGSRFAFLLDQDSVVRPGAVGTLLDEYRSLSGRFRVGALQAFNVEPDGRIPLDSRRRDVHRRRGRYEGPTSYQGLLLLNSGTLVPTDTFRAVGRLDERYFADFVDYEFSLRLARAGFAVFHVPSACIDHNRGPPERPNPRRLYYAVRELVHLIGSYGREFPDGVAPIAWTTMNRAASLTIRSGHPITVLGLTMRAVFDGLAGTTGEIPPAAPGARRARAR